MHEDSILEPRQHMLPVFDPSRPSATVTPLMTHLQQYERFFHASALWGLTESALAVLGIGMKGLWQKNEVHPLLEILLYCVLQKTQINFSVHLLVVHP